MNFRRSHGIINKFVFFSSIGTSRTERPSVHQSTLQYDVHPRRSDSHLAVLVAAELETSSSDHLYSSYLRLRIHVDVDRKFPMVLQQRSLRRRFKYINKIGENEQCDGPKRPLQPSGKARDAAKRSKEIRKQRNQSIFF